MFVARSLINIIADSAPEISSGDNEEFEAENMVYVNNGWEQLPQVTRGGEDMEDELAEKDVLVLA